MTKSGASGRSSWVQTTGPIIESINPTTGLPIESIQLATTDNLETMIHDAHDVFKAWRMVPAPKRGEIVREIGAALRDAKEEIGKIISLEVGKTTAEAEGEVQEAIDMADFACGLSRQLYGLSMHSERPKHRMTEQWHPLGVNGIITAFNFPCAVWAWNAFLAAICGNTMIWKPSLKAPLTAIAVHEICDAVMRRHGWPGVFNLIIGTDDTVGEALIRDRRIPLISATGSCRMGRHVAQVVAGRLGRCLLELGGNNAIIIDKSADLDLALRAVLFGAAGTTGQRCTTTRRLLIHEDVHDTFVERLIQAYSTIPIGDPREEGTLVGPLIDSEAVQLFKDALAQAEDQGGTILAGGRHLQRPGFFVEPTLVSIPLDRDIVHTETFAPILYLHAYQSLDEAIAIQNSVDQGLSSALFTDSLRAAERFLSHAGSDCGIANINIGTSGAEIGGAFGGEKDTGGGREAGSDSWKSYMRRQTCTINWGDDLPLAQGIIFG